VSNPLSDFIETAVEVVEDGPFPPEDDDEEEHGED